MWDQALQACVWSIDGGRAEPVLHGEDQAAWKFDSALCSLKLSAVMFVGAVPALGCAVAFLPRIPAQAAQVLAQLRRPRT